jgi:PAS domain S-box-containing protein
MKNITSPRVSIGFIATLLVLILNGVVAYQSISKIAENNRSATYTDRLLTILKNMLSTLKNVESGQREYLLTNNPQYLAAHRIDVVEIRTQLKSIEALNADSAQPNSRSKVSSKSSPLDLAKTQIDRSLSELLTTIDRRQPQVLTLVQQNQLSQQGQQAIDRIHQTIASLDRSERLTLDRLQAESRQSLTDTKIAFGISSLLDLLLLAFLYGLVSWDVTKQQRAESTLRDYATEFEELYHNAPCGYHSLDAAGKVVRINRTELQMLGYEESEIVGCKNIVDLLSAASIQKLAENISTVQTRGWISDLEVEMLRKDGRIVPVSATVVAIKDTDGSYLGARVTLIDISDRVRLRKQTRLSAEISQKIRQSLQLAEILQTAVEEVQKLLGVDRVLIFRFETDGSVTVVQEQVVAGYPAVMGSKIVDPCFNRSYYEQYAQGRVYNVADITQAGFKPCYVEFLQQFAVKASSIASIYLRDELWGLFVVHHCQAPRTWQPREVEILTQLATQIGIALAQAQLLEQERLQRQELARSNAELEQFAYITSHDLQEPLRMVISYLQLLARRYQGKLDSDADEFIGYAVDGAARMQALIQALLGYARVSSRKQPFNVVDCNLVLQDAIANLHVAITESAAAIACDPLPEVWGDATQLTQVFQNLIANAIKFRRAEVPPKIQISARQIDAHPSSSSELAPSIVTEEHPLTASAWCFAVADNGIGIEAQYLDRIFAIFQRLHTRVAYPGTGIGLSICKKIIERHGGKIWVESSPVNSDSVLPQPLSIQSGCTGSIFYFIIPAVSSILLQHEYNRSPH